MAIPLDTRHVLPDATVPAIIRANIAELDNASVIYFIPKVLGRNRVCMAEQSAPQGFILPVRRRLEQCMDLLMGPVRGHMQGHTSAHPRHTLGRWGHNSS